jgi:hypothetical protein
METDQLKSKASELWELIVRLETEKYDLEERQKRQDYDVSYMIVFIATTCQLPSYSIGTL